MDEQTKAYRRRIQDKRFTERWMVGKGLDVGCGRDMINKALWPKITEVDPYDIEFGHTDAQFLKEIENDKYDFVHSSHCLEHVKNPRAALGNWLRVVKPGGFVVVTIPEELLYESGCWPSSFNADHKHSFTLRSAPVIPSSINVMQLLWKTEADIEHVTLLTS